MVGEGIQLTCPPPPPRPAPPLTLIFRPNWGPKGRKKILETGASLPLSQGLDDHPPSPLFSRSGSGTAMRLIIFRHGWTLNLKLGWRKNKDRRRGCFEISEINLMFRTSAHFFFPTCHALTTWVELSAVKWYKKTNLRGNPGEIDFG